MADFYSATMAYFYSAIDTDDGIVMVGYTCSISEDNFDFWVVKTDFEGNVLWENEYGGSDYECCYSVEYIKDAGFILVGSTRSFGTYLQDVYIIHTDLEGDTIWTRTYGGYGEDVGYSVVKTPDYGFVIAGYTTSYIPVTECVL